LAGREPKENFHKIKIEISSLTLEQMNQLDAFGGDQEAVCYLCLDGGSEAGQPLRRDCACRGTDAGFVHLACLVKYAATKSKQLVI
jgi:hypothetical protein